MQQHTKNEISRSIHLQPYSQVETQRDRHTYTHTHKELEGKFYLPACAGG